MRNGAESSCCPKSIGLDLEPQGLRAGRDGQAQVIDAFSRFHPDWTALAPRIAFNPERYQRIRLFGDDNVEVLLLCWLPGQVTPVHDHGKSWGVSMAISGHLVERSYRHCGAGHRMEQTGATALTPGAVALESGDTIHRVANLSGEPAVSLHVYSPPLTAFGTYDIETGTSAVVVPAVEQSVAAAASA